MTLLKQEFILGTSLVFVISGYGLHESFIRILGGVRKSIIGLPQKQRRPGK